jgi:hypothetical protein
LERHAERRGQPIPSFRYTFRTVPKIISFLLLIVCAAASGWADDNTFHRIEVPDAKGRQIKAQLTFDDGKKAVEVQPIKGDTVSIPYGEIDKCSYEYTQHHRINEGTIATAPVGVGAVLMFTKSKSHWLEIDYHNDGGNRAFVLRMDKHEYIQILDALKAHTGIDAEILGNARKR